MNLAKLSRISVGCMVVSFGTGYAFHRLFVKSMSESPIYLDAMETVKQHSGVIHLLGEPITLKSPVLANSGMLLAGYSDVQVRVSGPKANGIIFLKAVKEEGEVKITSIQLQLGKDQSKRLLIRDSEKEHKNSEEKKVKQ